MGREDFYIMKMSVESVEDYKYQDKDVKKAMIGIKVFYRNGSRSIESWKAEIIVEGSRRKGFLVHVLSVERTGGSKPIVTEEYIKKSLQKYNWEIVSEVHEVIK